MCDDTIAPSDTGKVTYGYRKIHQGPVRDHNALGTPRRARGIDHIGASVWLCAGKLLRIDSAALIRRKNLYDILLCQYNIRARILYHKVYPVLGIGRIYGNIRTARLMDTDNRRHKLLDPVKL